MGYFKTTISNVSWSAGQRWSIRGLTFIRIAILARLLLPSQFGLVSIATLVLGFLEIFTETWINVFLIQEKDDIAPFLNTAWIISIIRGSLIGLIIILFSPLISAFFHSPASLPIIMTIALVPVIRGFINPSVVNLQKNLLFKKEFAYKLFLFFIDAFSTVILAILTRHPISLVLGMLISAVFEVFISFIYFRPLPKLLWERIKAIQILQRSKWITMAGIFDYLYRFGDNLAVGRMLGTSSLGLYDYAYKISGTPVSEISDVVARVSFPVFVKMNQDPVRLKKAFFKTTLTVCSVSTLIGLGLFVFARPVVLIVLGTEWAPAIPVLRVLSICGVAKSITGSVYPLLLAAKRNDYITWITFVGVMGMGVSIVPLISWLGIVGAGVAAIIGSFSSLPLSLYYVNKIFKSKQQPQ